MKKNKVKTTLSLIIIMVLCLSVGVYAAYVLSATEVSYTKSDGTTVSVKDALDELYAKSIGINAAAVSEDPYHFIGAGVRYSANGNSNWRILFSDGVNIYITTARVLDQTYNKSGLTYSEINAELSNNDNWSQYVDTTVADIAYGAPPEDIYKSARSSVGNSPSHGPNFSTNTFTMLTGFFDPFGDFDCYYIISNDKEKLMYSDYGRSYTGYINPCYCRPVVRLKKGVVLTEQYGYYKITVP